MTVTETRGVARGQGVLDLDGSALTPEAEALAHVLGDLEGRLLIYGSGEARATLAARIVAKLRDEHRLRLAPLERLPTANEPRGVPRAQADNLTPAQQAVRDILTRYGPQADHELAALYAALLAGDAGRAELGWEIPAQSDSALRFRRCELRDAGLVEDSGTKVATGRGSGRATVWRIARPDTTP